MQEPFRVSIHTLGCKLNFAESSEMADQLRSRGMEICADDTAADVFLVNSCSVTEHSDKKCRNLIRHLHRVNPGAMIAVTGCYAQLRGEEIAGIDGVDVVLSNRDKGLMADTIVRELEGPRRRILTSCPTERIADTVFEANSNGERTRSFLKVQDGCDFCCTYCTIHNARGASRNPSVESIVARARRIAADGRREIVLTGVNIGDFGRSTGETLEELLAALDGVDGIERYRISSLEPNLLTDRIIELCAGSGKFMPHFHIPIQSGSDRILRRMGRRYDTAFFRGRIERIRSLMPDAFIGIDVIVGFPSETDDDFRMTRDLFGEIRPSYLHVFPFSARENTPAWSMPQKVRESVKTQRARTLDSLCSELHREFASRYAGTVRGVLFEGRTEGGHMWGFTDNYLRVMADADPEVTGRIVPVMLGNLTDGVSAVLEGTVLTGNADMKQE